MPFSPSEAAGIARTFDLKALPAAFFDNPFAYYRALREHAPVKRQADGSIVLTRYADIEAVYKDTATFSSDKKLEFGAKYGQSPLYEHHTTSLVFNDPPLHTRVRRILTGALSPRAIAAMEPSLVALVDGLLDRAAAKGEIDLVEDFASAVPIEVIGNLLGVPHEEREPLRDWSLAILGALEHVLTPEQMVRGNTAVTAFLAYLETLIAARRRTLRDPDQDVLSRLIIGDAGGEQLTAKELLHNCIFLLNAGHETTTNLIGNGLVLLAHWPQEHARLVADPGLARTAIEEILRVESPNQLGNRITTRTARIGGVELPPQTPVHVVIGAGNRDPERFPDPDRFDIARDLSRHLAFASGPHQCVGMTLARLEGRIAIGRFVARFPRYRLTAPPLRSRRARFRGFASIPAHTG